MYNSFHITTITKPVVDPDLQISGGGGAWSQKKFFLSLRASFWSKNKGGSPSPGFATENPDLPLRLQEPFLLSS